MTALAVALVCVTVLVLWREAKPLLERLIAVHEARYLPPVKADEPVVEVPADIEQMASRWEGEWAQASVVGRARELYAETSDWDTVRQRLTQEMTT